MRAELASTWRPNLNSTSTTGDGEKTRRFSLPPILNLGRRNTSSNSPQTTQITKYDPSTTLTLATCLHNYARSVDLSLPPPTYASLLGRKSTSSRRKSIDSTSKSKPKSKSKSPLTPTPKPDTNTNAQYVASQLTHRALPALADSLSLARELDDFNPLLYGGVFLGTLGYYAEMCGRCGVRWEDGVDEGDSVYEDCDYEEEEELYGYNYDYDYEHEEREGREDAGDGKTVRQGVWEGMDVWYSVDEQQVSPVEIEPEQDELVFERMAPFEGARWVNQPC